MISLSAYILQDKGPELSGPHFYAVLKESEALHHGSKLIIRLIRN